MISSKLFIFSGYCGFCKTDELDENCSASTEFVAQLLQSQKQSFLNKTTSNIPLNSISIDKGKKQSKYYDLNTNETIPKLYLHIKVYSNYITSQSQNIWFTPLFLMGTTIIVYSIVFIIFVDILLSVEVGSWDVFIGLNFLNFKNFLKKLDNYLIGTEEEFLFTKWVN